MLNLNLGARVLVLTHFRQLLASLQELHHKMRIYG